MNETENEIKTAEPCEQAAAESAETAVEQTSAADSIAAPLKNDKPEPGENVIAGIVGAFLFALVGGLLYFLVYQTGFIAGICGLITVVLSYLGYQLFSGRKGSSKGVIFSVIMSVIVIAAAEYTCLAYIIYNEFESVYHINFFDAMRVTPAFLKQGEILGEVIRDLLIAYALGAVASFGTIKTNLAAAKRKNAAVQNASPVQAAAELPQTAETVTETAHTEISETVPEAEQAQTLHTDAEVTDDPEI